MKNLCGKTRPVDKPYEIWSNGTWTWKVLKKYQSPDNEAKNQYARWFCAVTSPFATDEMGDVYVREITLNATKTFDESWANEPIDPETKYFNNATTCRERFS